MMSRVKTYFRNILAIFLILISHSALAQKQDRIWLFADSAGIDFNDLANPVAINCNIGTPCFMSFSSIADRQGQLLFYVAGIDLSITPMRIFDKYGNAMLNGDTLIGDAWAAQGCMIIPFSSDTNKYFVFIANRNGSLGNTIYYSIVDMSQNGGLGSVISRNNFLYADYINEKLNAVKHANGRDWWMITQSNSHDSLFHKFLIINDSITGPFDQYIGSGDNINKAFGQMIFSKDGNKLIVASQNSTIDIFDFDRCTGILFNYMAVGEGVYSDHNAYFGCSISPNGNVLYTSTAFPTFKNVYQFDLTAVDILASKQTIISFPDTGQLQHFYMGQHLLGPDNRIYVMRGGGFHGPNTDTYFTHHMDVILQPDQLGTSCDYQSFFFDLGRGRTIAGLPTMLNYNLGPITGSICDSLTSDIGKLNIENVIKIFPNPFQNKIEIHSPKISGKIFVLNELGKIVIEENFDGNKSIETLELSRGVYFVRVEALDWNMTKKFVKVE